MKRRWLLVVVGAFVFSACGGGKSQTTSAMTPAGGLPGDAFAIVASTDLAVGPERLLLALAAPNGARLGAPDLPLTASLFPEEDPSALEEVSGSWVWAIPDVSGLYWLMADFDRAGSWFASIDAGGQELEPVAFTVAERSSTPAVGTPAPRSMTPTRAGLTDLSAITTDLHPDPSFYDLSIADAVTSGRPTVIVFATPKFCESAVCGPTLDSVKALKTRFPGVNFVHVEVYDLAASGEATSVNDLLLQPAVREWGLTSEPWVFVVDAAGNVSGRFEGVVAPAELEALLG